MNTSTHPQQSSLLSGRVLKRSLQTIAGRPPPDAPALKRLMLAQGELAQLWDGTQPIHYIAWLDLVEGTTRGNHYHEVKREIFYLIRGKVELIVSDITSHEREAVMLSEGDLVEIDVKVAHVYVTQSAGHALEFSSTFFNPADIVPYSVHPRSPA